MKTFFFSVLALCALIFATNARAEPTIELMHLPNGGIQPQVIAQNQSLHLIYFKGSDKAGDLFYAHSENEGRSWSAPLRVNSQAGSAVAMGAIRGAHLAIGADNRVFAVWNGSEEATPRNAFAPASLQKNGAAPLLFSRLNEARDAFEPQRNLLTRSFNLDGGASIAADSRGAVYVAWHANDGETQREDKRQVFLAISRDNGVTFSPEKPVWKEPTGACACCQVRLGVSQNRVQLLYRAATNMTARDSYFLSSNDGGRTFDGTKIHAWNINFCPMSSYALAFQDQQTIAAWESAEQVYFSQISTKNAAMKVVSAPGDGPNRKHPALAVNRQNQTLMAWTEGTTWNRGGRLRAQIFDANNQPMDALQGAPATPTWSFPAAFARSDGNFVLLF